MNKMSKGAAWTLLVIIAIFGLMFRLAGAYFSGNAS